MLTKCSHLGKEETRSLLFYFVLVFQVNLFLHPAVGKGKSSPFPALFGENRDGAGSKNGEEVAGQVGGIPGNLAFPLLCSI